MAPGLAAGFRGQTLSTRGVGREPRSRIPPLSGAGPVLTSQLGEPQPLSP